MRPGGASELRLGGASERVLGGASEARPRPPAGPIATPGAAAAPSAYPPVPPAASGEGE